MILQGDCREVLRTLDEASVDAIVTDPPYDLTSGKKGGSGAKSVNLDSPYGRARIGTGNGAGGFMGLAWDATGVAFDPATWEACLRVLRPGGHLLAFGGTRTYHRMACAIEDAGLEIRDQLQWLYGSGFPKSHNGPWGGTALKPANEPICMARKPLAGTVAENVQEHGTGALNIDGSRIEAEGGSPAAARRETSRRTGTVSTRPGEYNRPLQDRTSPERYMAPRPGEAIGRWPANVLLDEEAARLLDEQSGESVSVGGSRGAGGKNGRYGPIAAQPDVQPGYGDTGGASRFFYCAKPSKAERGENNTHPTVKPLDLLCYLIRLVTPPGGLVLDPFAGSGTTLLAAQQLGFRFVGIELSPEYIAIAERRTSQQTIWQEASA